MLWFDLTSTSKPPGLVFVCEKSSNLDSPLMAWDSSVNKYGRENDKYAAQPPNYVELFYINRVLNYFGEV